MSIFTDSLFDSPAKAEVRKLLVHLFYGKHPRQYQIDDIHHRKLAVTFLQGQYQDFAGSSIVVNGSPSRGMILWDGYIREVPQGREYNPHVDCADVFYICGSSRKLGVRQKSIVHSFLVEALPDPEKQQRDRIERLKAEAESVCLSLRIRVLGFCRDRVAVYSDFWHKRIIFSQERLSRLNESRLVSMFGNPAREFIAENPRAVTDARDAIAMLGSFRELMETELAGEINPFQLGLDDHDVFFLIRKTLLGIAKGTCNHLNQKEHWFVDGIAKSLGIGRVDAAGVLIYILKRFKRGDYFNGILPEHPSQANSEPRELADIMTWNPPLESFASTGDREFNGAALFIKRIAESKPDIPKNFNMQAANLEQLISVFGQPMIDFHHADPDAVEKVKEAFRQLGNFRLSD